NKSGNRKSKHQEASHLAAKPEVRAAIEAYEAQLMPIGELRACKERMLANIQHLAYHSPDHKVRLAASVKLHELIEAREQRENARAALPVTINPLITKIRQLEAPEPTVEIEAAAEDPEAPAPAEADE